MIKFHINKSGDPGVCKAQHNCPLGSDNEHFSTTDEARVFYEKKMTAELLPTGKNKDALKLSEVNKLAKVTSDYDIINRALAEGSNTTFKALAKNPHVGMHTLVGAYNSTDDPKTRMALVMHKHFPVGKMTGEEFVTKHVTVRASQRDYSRELLADDGFNDEHARAVLEKNANRGRWDQPIYMKEALANPRNGLSQELIVEVASKGPMDLDPAVRSGRFPAEKLKELPAKNMYWSTIDALNDDGYLKGYAEWIATAKTDGAPNHTAEYNGIRIASNPHSSASTLQVLVDNGIADEQVAVHPNATDAQREALASRNPTVARQVKLRALDKQLGGNLRGAILKDVTTVNPFGANRGISDSTIQLDTERIKGLGLSRDDVLEIMEYRKYNGGVSYNEETGVFTGTVDSTD